MKPTKLVDFEGIAKLHNVIVMFYEPKKDKGKNAGSVWRLVYGKFQHINDLPTINLGLLRDHCFYIKKMNVLCNQWACKGCRQIFTRKENLTRHLKDEKCKEEKQESRVQEVNLSTF